VSGREARTACAQPRGALLTLVHGTGGWAAARATACAGAGHQPVFHETRATSWAGAAHHRPPAPESAGGVLISSRQTPRAGAGDLPVPRHGRRAGGGGAGAPRAHPPRGPLALHPARAGLGGRRRARPYPTLPSCTRSWGLGRRRTKGSSICAYAQPRDCPRGTAASAAWPAHPSASIFPLATKSVPAALLHAVTGRMTREAFAEAGAAKGERLIMAGFPTLHPFMKSLCSMWARQEDADAASRLAAGPHVLRPAATRWSRAGNRQAGAAWPDGHSPERWRAWRRPSGVAREGCAGPQG
jgi:hypothetical protein